MIRTCVSPGFRAALPAHAGARCKDSLTSGSCFIPSTAAKCGIGKLDILRQLFRPTLAPARPRTQHDLHPLNSYPRAIIWSPSASHYTCHHHCSKSGMEPGPHLVRARRGTGSGRGHPGGTVGPAILGLRQVTGTLPGLVTATTEL